MLFHVYGGSHAVQILVWTNVGQRALKNEKTLKEFTPDESHSPRDLHHGVVILISPHQINATRPRLEGKIVWFLFVLGILASALYIGYREHDQDGGRMIKVYSEDS